MLLAMQSSAERVSALRKAATGAALVPIFGVVVAGGWMMSLLRRPICLDARTKEGLQFACQLPDLIQMYIATFGVWEPDLTAFIRSRLEPGDVFVDVGANIGWFTAVAARRVGDAGGVIAVEASPSMAEALRGTVERNALNGRVRISECAAAAEPGTLTIYAGPAHNRGLGTTVAGRGLIAEREVPARPLPEIVGEEDMDRVRLIKIDVEGGEPAVLAGLASAIDRLPPNAEILLELSPQWWDDADARPDEILRPFVDAGFNLYHIPNNYWPWRYLWPSDVRRPIRLRNGVRAGIRRADLVLSRRDAESL